MRLPTRPVLPLALGVIGPAIWAGSGFMQPPASAIVGAVGALIGVAGAIWAYRDSAAFRFAFVEDDWRPEVDGFVLTVSARLHRRGDRPIIKVNRRRDGGGHEEVMADVRTLEGGTVAVASTTRFDGELLIQ